MRWLSVALIFLSAPLLVRGAESGLAQREAEYRVRPMDTVEVRYRYTPDFNEILKIGPDGMVGSQVGGQIRAEGLTISELQAAIQEKAGLRLRDPEVEVILKDFVEPHYVVAGEVRQPGRFSLRNNVTALEAIAVAGGFSQAAKHSQVLLVRRLDPENARVFELNMKRMEKHPLTAEDPIVRADDLLIVPRSRLSKVERIVKLSNLGVFWNPAL